MFFLGRRVWMFFCENCLKHIEVQISFSKRNQQHIREF